MSAGGMAQSSFFAAFENKEALLLVLTKQMFMAQFNLVEHLVSDSNPLMIYATETALQMHIAELTEPIREMYVMAYSLPSTSEYICKNLVDKLEAVFSRYLPNAEKKDFYELDIASSGITRSFMAKKCNMYFTMEQKLQRYLSCCFKIYEVPEVDYQPVIDQVVKMDLHTVAENIVAETIHKAEMGFQSVMAESGENVPS